ncbi:MAG: fused MFS/spermidine synthase [Nanoarchaeota archaeon]|nr:fused MFS/spermidine synthase [Nanoarchaeota archaeon]
MTKLSLKNVLVVAFFLSGVATFLYEVVWLRPLELVFGSTIYAVSTILMTFLAGFSIGSYLFRNIADRSKNPLLLFSLLELGIGVYGVLIIFIISSLPKLYILLSQTPLFFVLKFIFIFLVLIIPTTLMGATWPVVNKAYSSGVESLGLASGRLYSSNSLGNALGALLAGFVLIPLFGILNSSIFAASLNIVAALMIFVWSKRRYHDES